MDLQQILDLGNEHYLNKNYEEALKCYTIILEAQPDLVDVWHNKGLTLTQLERFDEALEALVLPIQHNYVESILTRGSIKRSQGYYHEAMNDFGLAFLLNPNHDGAYSNYGNSLREFGMPKLGARFCQIAQDFNPTSPTHRLNESVCHLMAGDLVEGWKKYDGRWFYQSDKSFKPQLPGIEYDGTQDLINKTVFVYTEQGFGDAIQFARFIPMLQNRGAKVNMYCRSEVNRFLTYNLPGVSITSDSESPQQYHYHVALMDLPKCFGINIDTIPQVNYSVADDEVANWFSITGPKTKPRVGIVWSSTRAAWTTRFRNVPLELLLSIGNDSIELVNLEYDVDEDTISHLNSHGVKVYNEHIKDFYSTAGLIKTLDLVVTVDTAISHLAASMNIPTWVMLADYAVDWRWFLNRTNSPFYESVHLFRQTGQGWEPVIADIKSRLDTK